MQDTADSQTGAEEGDKDFGEERPIFKSNFFVPAHPLLMIGKFSDVWVL